MIHFSINDRFELEIKNEGQLLGCARINLSPGQFTQQMASPQNLKFEKGLTSAFFMDENGRKLEIKLQMKELEKGDAVSLVYSLCNHGDFPMELEQITLPRITLNRDIFGADSWTMQGAAVGWGQDFAFPAGSHKRENFLGHLQDGEGGGIPVTYFWNRSIGLALMHIEAFPKDWYMPVDCTPENLTISLEQRESIILQPGQTFTGLRTVIAICKGDFSAPLALYRQFLAEQGIKAPEPVPADYDAAWCSWGYEFDVNAEEMIGVLPVLDELDIHWLTLDDRWFDAYGDWNPRKDTFPGGKAELRKMNDRIHQAGSFSQLWWYPLCVEDGHGEWDSHAYGEADLFQKHPGWIILDKDGQVARNNRHLAMLCPALPEVQEHIRELTLRFIQDWSFDGHKLDNIYTIPACYNPSHHHSYPQESTEAMAEAYRIIFETTRSLRPDSVTQICPCGTPLSMQLIPWTDQTVTADPVSSWQIRQRIKFYKALCGPKTAVFADHVELSDGGMDFASEIGTGGVPATKFVWPEDDLSIPRLKEYWNMPPEKQEMWKKWLDIYNQHRISEGEYLNLYDLAFDVPETHAIQKGTTMYYGFFQGQFQGVVNLRGLEKRTYHIVDYVHESDLGKIDGSNPVLKVNFEKFLLLAAIPD
jgi:alpha-galactosidase